jgi:hypothetical protein
MLKNNEKRKEEKRREESKDMAEREGVSTVQA